MQHFFMLAIEGYTVSQFITRGAKGQNKNRDMGPSGAKTEESER